MISKSRRKMLAKLKKPREFAQACEGMSNEDIYELFEEIISDKLRSKIYRKFWSFSPEPCRAAMIQLGARYCVQELLDY